MSNKDELLERSQHSMATLVKMRLQFETVGGGDYVGDADGNNMLEQFVWRHGEKADLGWCVGVHMCHMAVQAFQNPKELLQFLAAIQDGVEEHLEYLRDKLDEIDNENKDAIAE
jgi:hypothetical protein